MVINDDVNEHGQTILHRAIMRGDMLAVRTLLAADTVADYLNVVDNAGKNAVHYAAEYGYATMIAIIATHPQWTHSINAQDHEGKTALHYAIAGCGHPGCG